MREPSATARLETPIGLIAIEAADDRLTRIRIGAPPTHDRPSPLLNETIAQLAAWFDGRLTRFDLPLTAPEGEEGEKLRAGIAAIPYGETRTYGAVAQTTGSIARAVGQACKTNAFPIIIPCHRVVSASGPEYYSAGDGPRTKGWLIDFEVSNLPPDQRTRLL